MAVSRNLHDNAVSLFPFILDVVKEDDPSNNVSDSIFEKIGVQLHNKADHPLGILKNTIYNYFDRVYGNKFNKFDDLFPIVSVKAVGLLGSSRFLS